MIPHGDEYVYVICSVCKGKYHRKDATLIQDKWHPQNGQIVCKWDIDQINEQVYPVHILETPPSDPAFLTGEAQLTFEGAVVDNRLPGKPLNPYAVAANYTDGVELYWQAPDNQGSSDIQGYIVKRANPQLSTYDTVTSNSLSPMSYYNDTTADKAEYYTYKVAAINTFGTGPYSDEFYYPINIILWDDINYLVASQDGNAIETGSGLHIRLNHLEAGVI